jgi:(1->4)-alpha-D-glucan 1-alpha-D-glucosylmutase
MPDASIRRFPVPLATYRLQFNREFRFSNAINLLDYFSRLGITDLYASPILMSRAGSGHGYDVIDPTRLDPEIGSEQEFEALQGGLIERGMGLVLDIVPNHMAASSENPWWMDVLENGSSSAFASYFDINWHSASPTLYGKVLLPVLGSPFGDALDAGEIRLVFEQDKFLIRYFDSVFPVSPMSYHEILGNRSDALKREIGESSGAYQEYSGILAGFASLAEQSDDKNPLETRPKVESLRDRLKLLVSSQPAVASFLESNLAEFNGHRGDPASFSKLERLLNGQNYLLTYWQDQNEGINYRRFFAISELVGVRVEDPVVFDATHKEIFRLIAKGASKGLRIGLRVDHIDGLRDPDGYLQRLRQSVSELSPARESKAYLIVEKILARDEILPSEWPIDGTTGYEFMNYLNGLFVRREGAEQIKSGYFDFTGRKLDYLDVVYEKKKQVMNSLLRVEIRDLARQLALLAAKDRYARNVSRLELIDALTEVIAGMTVYRTYIRTLMLPPAARSQIEHALHAARERRPQLSSTCLDFVRDVLTLASPPHVGPEQLEERLAFVMRWQQFTGPIMAKGVEDTALYAYYPLSSLNEVGGDPEPENEITSSDFFNFLHIRQQHWPNTMNATSTHDTKRSEDVRARINVLSEMPAEWLAKLTLWSALNAPHKQMINGQNVPEANEEYLIYQTLIGMWPADGACLQSITKRVQDYMIKAIREAKLRTRWTQPNEPHENAIIQFVGRISSRDTAPEFLDDFSDFHARIAWCGMINGLSQVLMKITCPGLPDFYQGAELWDFHLVDPDNRSPVAFNERCKALRSLADTKPAARELLANWLDGRIKMHVMKTALENRLKNWRLFTHGELLLAEFAGEGSEDLISFWRHDRASFSLTVVPRWLAGCFGASHTWPPANFRLDGAISLPESAPRSWINVLTGKKVQSSLVNGRQSLPVSDVIGEFPVAMLLPEDLVG